MTSQSAAENAPATSDAALGTTSTSVATEIAKCFTLLHRQAHRLEYFAYFYFFSFFLIVFSAYVPFNSFQQAVRNSTDTNVSYVPLVLGVSFMLGMIVSMLALIQVLGAQNLQKISPSVSEVENQTQLAAMRMRITRLKRVSLAALALFATALAINMVTAVLAL